ncbi:MAG: (E)-4-hydroxy-3-methylbut-2-enyl-diphosphate synthase [Gammaproteobacteria bacterium]|nr:(E)-4-hydroxy-3-methylbut-2-enyl-diphosphate synthase [Gammaproteobacteria bacterium]MCY4229256.1 (E)-4-hydroxy-3-methylbut-2-enyl-diphosphate synthase [Gammaproteobacteria bacterium]
MIKRNPTREVKIGAIAIGNGNPIAVQSMCATPTRDIDSTLNQLKLLEKAGADVIRIAADNKKDAQALIQIRQETDAVLSVDLQENYRLAEIIAPHVEKIRYNPGHLYHHQRSKPWQDKVSYLAEIAVKHDCAMRVGVNAGSVDPDQLAKYPKEDSISPMIDSALAHTEWLDQIGFTRYCVSLKDSDPEKTISAYLRFAEQRPEIPLHVGVTEAGMPPEGIEKTRIAFEQIIGKGIGDTVRVSLTLPHAEKHLEIDAGRQILKDISEGRVRTVVHFHRDKLNLISCPSCSRVENEAFIDLARKVKDRTKHAEDHAITIAVMGCRVNGPGETDDADLGLWCGPNYVNLKRHGEKVGAFTYDEILDRLDRELESMIN